MWKMMQYWANVGTSNSETKKYDLVVWDFPHFSTTFRFVSLCVSVLVAVEIRFPTRAVFSHVSHKFAG